MTVQSIIFYGFASLVVASGAMVIFSQNPIKSALFLVLAFFSSAATWILIEAEFLALILIFVYVGAVMTLLLFVVMMLHLEPEKLKGGLVRYLPMAVILVVAMGGIIIYLIAPTVTIQSISPAGVHYSNIQALGSVLYTEYAYPLELAAVLLLIAIIAAVCLTHRTRVKTVKAQTVALQLEANKANRLRMVSMPAELQSKEEEC